MLGKACGSDVWAGRALDERQPQAFQARRHLRRGLSLPAAHTALWGEALCRGPAIHPAHGRLEETCGFLDPIRTQVAPSSMDVRATFNIIKLSYETFCAECTRDTLICLRRCTHTGERLLPSYPPLHGVHHRRLQCYHSMAAAHERLPHLQAEHMMVSCTECYGEGWQWVDKLENVCMPPVYSSRSSDAQGERFMYYPGHELPTFLHYCQSFKVNAMSFYKRHLRTEIFNFSSSDSPGCTQKRRNPSAFGGQIAGRTERHFEGEGTTLILPR